MSDAEWVILAPFPPLPSRYGRRRKWEIREIINAIFYVLRGGITWSLLPKEFPPRPKTYRWFTRLHDDGTWETINHHLVTLDRERVAREASPTAAVIDSQSVKMTKSSGIRGYDKGEAIKGRKLHVMADADARVLKLHAHSADIQDRDGAGPLPLRVASEADRLSPWATPMAATPGPRVANASPIRIKVVQKSDNQVGFAVRSGGRHRRGGTDGERGTCHIRNQGGIG